MSKIICDICGTSYADTATQCPICGCVRPAQPQPIPESDVTSDERSGGYTYVKGGRFSKTNVKKRTAADKAPKNDNEGKKKGSVVLLIVIILIGVIALGAILWATGVLDALLPGKGAPASTPAPTTPTLPPVVSCESLIITEKKFTLAQVGDSALIDCRKIPAESTDDITYISENELIATVDANGKVTAVQNGTTNIIITCGTVTEACEIVVGDGVFPVELVLDYTELNFTAQGEWKDLYSGPIPADRISWATSNDYMVSVDDKGRVTALMSGEVTITATYMDKTATCHITCDIEPGGNSGGITEDGGNGGSSGGITEDGGNGGSSGGITEDGADETYTLYASFGPLYFGNDITVSAGKEFTLYLKSSSGNLIDVEWTCKPNEYVSTEGGKIKALKAFPNNYITVKTEYKGVSYSCKIRVS